MQLFPPRPNVQRLNFQRFTTLVQMGNCIRSQYTVNQQEIGLGNIAHLAFSLAASSLAARSQISQRGVPRINACRCAGTNNCPALSVSACFNGPGNKGAAPVPFPGLPPEFILITGPLKVTAPASILIKLPPPLRVSSLPASSTTFRPLLR